MLAASCMLFSCAKETIVDPPAPEPSRPEESAHLLDFGVLADGRTYSPIDTTGGHFSIFVPIGTDLSQLVLQFNDRDYTVKLNGEQLESGASVCSFRDYKNGTPFQITSADGKTKNCTVRVLDTQLPVVSVTTTDRPGSITSRVTWREAVIRIRTADGKMQELGTTGIRGRGNWTWEKYPKKPYALKLDHRQEVLGMPAHKRWVLLALYRGFIGNALMFEATRRASALGWAPRGCFVEMVLNGKYQGLYYLCEAIKIDRNRVNITELKTGDVTYPAVSGGYLLEYDELFDETFKFKTQRFHLPVQLKAPNDTVPDAQLDYIRGFINDMETELLKIGTSEESHYSDYLDPVSFADYWLVLETVGNYEAWKPRSVKMYKGRDGVDSPAGTVCRLKAGPLWDQELFQVNKSFNSRNMYYYKYLFKDPAFVALVKERWALYKSSILGNENYEGFLDYLNAMVAQIKESARRDIAYWDNPYFTLGGEVSPVRTGFLSKIEWMDRQIQGL